MESENNVFITGLKYNPASETRIGYGKQLSKDDISCYERIVFDYYSPIPESERRTLRIPDEPGLEFSRKFASITIEPLQEITLFRYLNSESYANANDYRQYFSRYLTEDGGAVKPEYKYANGTVKFCVLLSEFKRIYSKKGIERDKKSGTYSLDPRSFQTPVSFEQTRLLDANWSGRNGRSPNYNRLISPRSIPGEGRIGEKTHFMHPTSAGLLWKYVEARLQALGFDCIFLDADTMSLAVKIYGNWGYYPMWKTNLINEEGDIQLDGDKIAKLTDPNSYIREGERPESRESIYNRLVSCDTSSGTTMFKFINPAIQVAKYDWTFPKLECQSAAERVKRVANPTLNRNRLRAVVPTPNRIQFSGPTRKKYGTFGGRRSRVTRKK